MKRTDIRSELQKKSRMQSLFTHWLRYAMKYEHNATKEELKRKRKKLESKVHVFAMAVLK